MTTITNPDPNIMQLLTVRSALNIMAKTGMNHSRYTGKQLLAIATKHTGIPYKRGQYAKALADLNVIRIAIFGGQPVRLNATSDI